jgi:hypothetical protein
MSCSARRNDDRARSSSSSPMTAAGGDVLQRSYLYEDSANRRAREDRRQLIPIMTKGLFGGVLKDGG